VSTPSKKPGRGGATGSVQRTYKSKGGGKVKKLRSGRKTEKTPWKKDPASFCYSDRCKIDVEWGAKKKKDPFGENCKGKLLGWERGLKLVSLVTILYRRGTNKEGGE